jgi:hypothetical protein
LEMTFFVWGRRTGNGKGKKRVSPLRRHSAPPSVEMTVLSWV